MKILIYCKEKKGILIYGIISVFLPQVIMALAVERRNPAYRLWSTNCRYCSILLLFFLLLYLFLDYRKLRKKCNQLSCLVGLDGLDYVIALPIADSQLEKLYITLMMQSAKNAKKELSHFLEQKNEDLEFIETWVHEIKTPIAASKLLIENGLDHPTEEVLFHISDEMLRIEDMVQKTIYYSQLQDIEKDCQIDQVNLKKVIHACLQSQYAGIREKKIKIKIKDIDFKVYSDEKWLCFIVRQIMDNAIKYSKEDTSIHIYGCENGKDKTLIIEDEGIGIRQEDQRRIFEKGYTGINGRNNMSATGIGLYLSQKLAQKLGHQILITSQVHIGTKVEIHFKY